ncbi:MAG: DUF4838 domain-containing protein, partial [Oscillospiraceae bacterium]|nr:DUF4838 domain-containing protein [Oscillospiraceae bacterium]
MSIKLSENGKCLFAIAASERASASEIHAAEQLKTYLDKITSLDFPVGDREPGQKPIIVGWGAEAEKLTGDLGVDALGDEGFAIKSTQDYIIIAGGRLRGTLYGIYEFLERLGCRFFTPQCELVPSACDLSAPAMDIKQKPLLEYRDHHYRFYFEYPDFAVKSRVNGHNCKMGAAQGGHIPYAYFVHSFNALMPPEKYYDSHPEYFSLVDGKRLKDLPQLCLTNPDVLAIVVEQVKAKLRSMPEARIISVSQNDWDNHCDCDGCRAIDEREGARSGSLIAFINAVAEAVEPEFPDVVIDTLAYQQTRPAPKTLRPRHNVCVRL